MDASQRYQQTKRVTLLGAWLNALLGVIKIIVGYIAHSQVLVADGIHSLSDLVTDGIVIVAAKFGNKKPDEDHPYGHRRIETVATIVVAILIIIIGVGIVFDAIYVAISVQDPEHTELAAVIVAVIGVLIKEFLYRYTLAVARRTQSNLLHASAWHHRSDVFVSLLVLIGVIGGWLGYNYIDTIAAVFVGGLIVKLGWRMMWEGGKELVDTGVDEQTLSHIKNEIADIPGVRSLHQLRTRLVGGTIFVDTHVLVAPYISVSEGHYISEQVGLRLAKHFKRIHDVTVHIDPEDDEVAAPSVHLPNRVQIETYCRDQWQHVPGSDAIKKIILHFLAGKITVEIVLPLSVLNLLSAEEMQRKYWEAICKKKEIHKLNLYFE